MTPKRDGQRLADRLQKEAKVYRAAAVLMDGRSATAREYRRLNVLLTDAATWIVKKFPQK